MFLRTQHFYPHNDMENRLIHIFIYTFYLIIIILKYFTFGEMYSYTRNMVMLSAFE